MDRVEKQTRVSINGRTFAAAVDKSGYISLDRNWKDGDVVEIEFPFETRRVIADPKVRENRGRMAIERGPIVYCSEWPDVKGGHVLDLLFDAKAELRSSFDQEFYGGADRDRHGSQENRAIRRRRRSPSDSYHITYGPTADPGK